MKLQANEEKAKGFSFARIKKNESLRGKDKKYFSTVLLLRARESLELNDKEYPAQRDYSVENSGTTYQGKKHSCSTIRKGIGTIS